ncbi:hypothetical protein L6R46_20305 [Myxococcota bacterium]|nr:hypothetical protein [Myxococcota bacterium]
MNPLFLLGWIGIPAVLASNALTDKTLADEDLSPDWNGWDQRKLTAGAGLASAMFLPAPFNLLALGVGLGGMLSWFSTEKVARNLKLEALNQARARLDAGQGGAPPMLPGPPGVPMDPAAPPAPAAAPDWWTGLFRP